MTQRRETVGRGAQISPPNRFERIRLDEDLEQLASDDELLAESRRVPTEYFVDDSQSIVSQNDSPDVGFRWSVNPYRGCSHGCAYCYARPTHEYLGLNAGLDFETKILVKLRAPDLLRDWLARSAWSPEPIAFSGVTDCYQPAERQFRLTRRCLEVACAARQPISIVTKNALVTRDLDVLAEMATRNTVCVMLSITTLDQALTRVLEPRTSAPAARLQALRELRAAGVPAGVLIAPIIPGLNDSEVPRMLLAARDAGAQWAGFIVLRLPLGVQPVFLEWLERTQPLHQERVLSRIRATRGGQLDDSRFCLRMSGEGVLAEQIAQTFAVFARKYGLDCDPPELDAAQFRSPRPTSGQLRLFD